ncbi:hypothetical protein J4573_47535 [Actinomadura barringtoniae]|uniref:Uncharacterized protein n=1 Tax=Actinomadura barringtoniae TaxID=1427535 RepID=A0A939PMJ5_9ACTN|nr:hypothetical protein [Actinomadura barringtoniae]MBO2454813.1 hypothetical protein [Actinomadura barringtoniae]
MILVNRVNGTRTPQAERQSQLISIRKVSAGILVAGGAMSTALVTGAPAASAAPDAPQAAVKDATAAAPLTVEKISQREMMSKKGYPAHSQCYAWKGSDGKAGESCFQWTTDDQWIRDTADNGMNFRVHIKTNYGKERWCYSTGGSWSVCKYDHKENKCVKFHGYHPPHALNKELWTPYFKVSNGKKC